MQFKQYLAQTQKEYPLRLKTIVPLDDAAMDRIEMAVAKYLPLSIGRPQKTIIQRQPLEFPEIRNAEVYIVDLVFGMPSAPHILRDVIRTALDAPEGYVFVRGQHEPGELEMERMNAIADIELEAAEKGLVVSDLLSDSDYNEAESHSHDTMYGNAYNAALLSYLSKVQKERADHRVKVANAPFTWLDLPDRQSNEIVQDDADFNANIADAPRIAPQGIKTPETSRNILGHFEAGNRNEVRRIYKDADGNRVVLARKLTLGDVQ